jgi:hypothetical protein
MEEWRNGGKLLEVIGSHLNSVDIFENQELFDRCVNKLFSIDKDSFNTSFPKIMDKLIIAFVKGTLKPQRTRKQPDYL